MVLVDGARVEVEDVGDHADLAARAGDRLADVLRLDQRELLVVLLDERREPPKQPPAISGRDRAPSRKRRACARNGRVGLVDAGLLERRDRLLGRRVQNGEAHAPDLITLVGQETVDKLDGDRALSDRRGDALDGCRA